MSARKLQLLEPYIVRLILHPLLSLRPLASAIANLLSGRLPAHCRHWAGAGDPLGAEFHSAGGIPGGAPKHVRCSGSSKTHVIPPSALCLLPPGRRPRISAQALPRSFRLASDEREPASGRPPPVPITSTRPRGPRCRNRRRRGREAGMRSCGITRSPARPLSGKLRSGSKQSSPPHRHTSSTAAFKAPRSLRPPPRLACTRRLVLAAPERCWRHRK